MENKFTLVVSAVNLRKGGTLTILRDCLNYLSDRIMSGEKLRVVALVHKRALCDFPGIEYIEMPWCIRSWAHRLWAEYVTMKGISRKLAPVDLWLSLHDTTPRVVAKKQEVYCHTSFPFLKIIPRDWVMNPKIPVFAIMGRVYYRINVRRNDSIIVQQKWFAQAMSGMLGLPMEKFRVIPPAGPSEIMPAFPSTGASAGRKSGEPYRFLYVSTPDCHKNFETLCEAASLLEKETGTGKFTVTITLGGNENRYARWIYRKWGGVESIVFRGLLKRDELFREYADADCFVFPSRIETWGLPISEYIAAHPGGKLLLADLPYARETSLPAARDTDFFEVMDVVGLKNRMREKLLPEK